MTQTQHPKIITKDEAIVMMNDPKNDLTSCEIEVECQDCLHETFGDSDVIMTYGDDWEACTNCTSGDYMVLQCKIAGMRVED